MVRVSYTDSADRLASRGSYKLPSGSCPTDIATSHPLIMKSQATFHRYGSLPSARRSWRSAACNISWASTNRHYSGESCTCGLTYTSPCSALTAAIAMSHALAISGSSTIVNPAATAPSSG